MDYDPEAYVFLTRNGQQIQYNNVLKKFRAVAVKAGVEKPVTPHIFRHSRITHLIQQGYSESVIKLMMWGNVTTSMFRTYAHLGNRDIDKEIALHQGILMPDRRDESVMKPRQCPRCHDINSPTAVYCEKCGLPLTPDAADEIRQTEQQIELMPEYQALLKEFEARLRDIPTATIKI
jgi:uncharacterized paraquat-inducible protein A